MSGRSVWGDSSPPPWPLSLTSDYHSDGRETPATGRSAAAAAPPPPPADASLSSAYSWDVQPSPRSLPSSPPQEEEEEDSPPARSDGSSSAWSSVHESDCDCSLLRLTGVVAGVARSCAAGQGARRRPGSERACRRRRTHAQLARRETRRYSELRGNRLERYRHDDCRSSDDEMDAERGEFRFTFPRDSGLCWETVSRRCGV